MKDLVIAFQDGKLIVETIGPNGILILSTIPAKRWNGKDRRWELALVKTNISCLNKCTNIEIKPAAKEAMKRAVEKMETKLKAPPVGTFPAIKYKFEPKQHQKQALDKLWGVRYGGLFCEPGTGKTKMAIDMACALFLKGEIDTMLVVCPTSLKLNWEEQLAIHMAYDYFLLKDTKKKRPEGVLEILIVGSESLSTKTKDFEKALELKKTKKLLTVFDESHFFKNHESARTKNGALVCGQRGLILTGTPISQGVQDLYGQFSLMDRNLVGSKDFFCFRNRYCVMGGFKNKQIVGSANVQELVDTLEPFVFQVKKADCLDLPEKCYQKVVCKMLPEQRKAYELCVNNILKLPDRNVDIEHVLVQFLNLQQISAGFFTVKTETEHFLKEVGSSKYQELENLILSMPQDAKVVVFARFIYELDKIAETLQPFGGVSKRDGRMSEEEKDKAVREFRTGNNRFFVTSQAAGGTGLTLVEASTCIFFSNTFSMVERVQSEDRLHRLGAQNPVLYVDLVSQDSVDQLILDAIEKKTDFAQYVSSLMGSGKTLKQLAKGATDEV